MAAGQRARDQIGTLMISSVVALGVSVISSAVKAEDDASRFTYTRLYCTPDNQSHFTDVTTELAKENFAPPASPVDHRRQQARVKGVHRRICGTLGRW